MNDNLTGRRSEVYYSGGSIRRQMKSGALRPARKKAMCMRRRVIPSGVVGYTGLPLAVGAEVVLNLDRRLTLTDLDE